MTAYRQTPSLSEETIRLAERYFSQRRRKTRASILLPFVILIPVIIIGSIWGAKASTALFVPLTVSSIVHRHHPAELPPAEILQGRRFSRA